VSKVINRFSDDRDPRFFGNAGKDPDARLKIVQGGVKRHLELHPEQSTSLFALMVHTLERVVHFLRHAHTAVLNRL